MTITQEFEVNDGIYTVEATISQSEASTWDYEGSAATIDIFTIYDEQGCEITGAIDYELYWSLEDMILEYYENIE